MHGEKIFVLMGIRWDCKIYKLVGLVGRHFISRQEGGVK